MACIPFKLYNHLLANEFYYCSCKFRIFKIRFLRRKQDYSMNVRARNCFHCWFLLLVEIKVKIIFEYRNNIFRFASLLGDFFKLINEFKYIYLLPNFKNTKYYDSMFNFFSYYLNEYDSCFCYCPPTGSF